MHFSYLLAIHIVFVVSWFAALFYIVRLFIYTSEAQQRDEVAREILTVQMLYMQKKLWFIIGWPAMAGTVIFGTWLLALNWSFYLSQPWMWLKLISVLLLLFYHFECQRIHTQQKKRIFIHSSFKLRLFNELATIFLVAIVFLVIVKSTSGLVWGILGLLGFAGAMMLAVVIYKKNRVENHPGERRS